MSLRDKEEQWRREGEAARQAKYEKERARRQRPYLIAILLVGIVLSALVLLAPLDEEPACCSCPQVLGVPNE